MYRMSHTMELYLDQKGGVPIQNSGMTALSGAVRRLATVTSQWVLWSASGFMPAI